MCAVLCRAVDHECTGVQRPASPGVPSAVSGPLRLAAAESSPCQTLADSAPVLSIDIECRSPLVQGLVRGKHNSHKSMPSPLRN